MKVKKVFNNNILLAENEHFLEMILMGKGVGFGLKPNDIVDESKVEKIYRLDSKGLQNQFTNLTNNIPANHLELTKLIIDQAEEDLNIKFDDSIFIGLADHISFAIKRAKDNDELSNALLWEIKKFYKKEYQAALKSLDLIEYHENIRMANDEAGYIAMHFVNGQQNDGNKKAAAKVNVIQDILNIVKFHYKIDLNEDSANYIRFVTHIRYYLERTHNSSFEDNDDYLYEQVKIKYPDTYRCVQRIKVYFKEKIGIEMNREEMLYFMLHIQRLTEREKKSITGL